MNSKQNQNTKANILSAAIEDIAWIEKAKWNQANEDWLEMSRAIAVKILRFLRENQIMQKDLADRLGFSPQYVSKIVKGSENLTLETISKIEKALNFQLLKIDFQEDTLISAKIEQKYRSLTITHKSVGSSYSAFVSEYEEKEYACA